MICNECEKSIILGDHCIETAWGDYFCMGCAHQRVSDVVCSEHDFNCNSCGSRLINHIRCVVIPSDGTNLCDTCAWETVCAA